MAVFDTLIAIHYLIEFLFSSDLLRLWSARQMRQTMETGSYWGTEMAWEDGCADTG